MKFVNFLVVNNNKYLSYVVDNIIFRISVPDYPSRTVESNSLCLFWNFCIFCLLYIHINNNKFTYDKFKSAKFGLSIFDMFSHVLLKLFTFLINTADIEIYNIFDSFLFPQYFNTNLTNKHTNKHKSKISFVHSRSHFLSDYLEVLTTVETGLF